MAIIALALVLFFNRNNHGHELVTIDSDGLLRGLGIERRTCRRYDEDRDWEAEDGPATESSTVSCMMVFSMVVILGLGTWLYWSGKIL